MIPSSFLVSLIQHLMPTIAEAVQRGEPIYVIPPEERQPEITVRADMLGGFLAEQRDWGHANLELESIHAAGHRGRNTLVAICDTGIDVDHPDLKGRIRPAGNKDFTGSRSGFFDVQGHGTHCAGIAFASADGSGIIGAAPEAAGIAVKVLDDTGSGASSWIAAGIRHAADQGADVISLSLGGPSPDPATRAAVQYAASKGAWIVIAAGNDGRPASSYPGHYPESCAVAATDKQNQRATFSTINPQNDVAAPGVSIWSTLPEGRYGSMSGTSMATPYVAGCLALVRGAIKAAGARMPSQDELIAALRETSTDIAPPGADANTGTGLIGVKKLIERFAVPATPPPVEPPPTTPPTDPPTDPPTLPPAPPWLPPGSKRYWLHGQLNFANKFGLFHGIVTPFKANETDQGGERVELEGTATPDKEQT